LPPRNALIALHCWPRFPPRSLYRQQFHSLNPVRLEMIKRQWAYPFYESGCSRPAFRGWLSQAHSPCHVTVLRGKLVPQIVTTLNPSALELSFSKSPSVITFLSQSSQKTTGGTSQAPSRIMLVSLTFGF